MLTFLFAKQEPKTTSLNQLSTKAEAMKRHLEDKAVTDEPNKKKIKVDHEKSVTVELPPELLETIAAFILDDRSRRRLRVVSKKWSKIMNYTTFTFSPLLSSEIPQLVSIFSASSPCGLRLLKANKHSYNSEDLIHLSKLTQLTSFIGNFKYLVEWGTRQRPVDEFLPSLTNLESLEVTHVHYDKLYSLTKLRRLAVTTLRNLSDPILPLNLPHLQELSIYISDLPCFEHLHGIKHLEFIGGFKAVRKLPFTALESLTLHNILLEPLPATLTRLETLYRHEGLTNIAHLTNLKHLEIEPFDNMPLHLFQRLEVCKLWGSTKKTASIVSDLALLPHLRDLRIELRDDAEKCIQVIGAITTLQALSLEIEEPIKATPLSALTDLTSLRYSNTVRTTSYDWLKQLTSLRELDLCIQVDRRLSRDSLNLMSLSNLTRLVINQIGSYTAHCLTNFTNLLDLKLQARCDDAGRQFVGLGTLTQLTSLEVVFQTTDDDWQEIIKLTNLMSLSEIEYVGNKSARLLDLTAMQKLTRFVSQEKLHDGGWNFTALTTLQYIDANLDGAVEKAVREKLLYLENPEAPLDHYEGIYL